MKSIFPYSTLAGDLRITRVTLKLDGAAPEAFIEDIAQSKVNVYAAEIGCWQVLTLEVRVDGPASELRLFEAKWGGVDLTLIVESSRSLMRLGCPLARDRKEPALWTATLDLSREDFLGDAQVRAVMSATVDGVPHREVARTADWTIHFDRPATPNIDGSLPIKWSKFKTPPAGLERLRPYADLPSYVDFVEAVPVLYLNSSTDHLPVLLDEARSGKTKAEDTYAQSVASGFASQAWVAMFGAAAAAAGEANAGEDEGDDDGPSDGTVVAKWPDEEWQRYVLTTLLPLMNSYSSLTMDHALVKLVEDWTSGSNAGTVQSEVQAAVSAHLLAARPLRKMLKLLYEEGVAP